MLTGEPSRRVRRRRLSPPPPTRICLQYRQHISLAKFQFFGLLRLIIIQRHHRAAHHNSPRVTGAAGLTGVGGGGCRSGGGRSPHRVLLGAQVDRSAARLLARGLRQRGLYGTHGQPVHPSASSRFIISFIRRCREPLVDRDIQFLCGGPPVPLRQSGPGVRRCSCVRGVSAGVRLCGGIWLRIRVGSLANYRLLANRSAIAITTAATAIITATAIAITITIIIAAAAAGEGTEVKEGALAFGFLSWFDDGSPALLFHFVDIECDRVPRFGGGSEQLHVVQYVLGRIFQRASYCTDLELLNYLLEMGIDRLVSIG